MESPNCIYVVVVVVCVVVDFVCLLTELTL